MNGASFRLTAEDYIKAGQLHLRPSPRQILAFAAVALLMFTLMALWLQMAKGIPPGKHALSYGIMLTVLAALALLYYFVIHPILARRAYGRYKQIHGQFHATLGEDKLVVTSDNGVSNIPWNHVFKWRGNKDHVLVYIAPRLFFALPTSIHSPGFDVTLLQARLRQHVGRPG